MRTCLWFLMRRLIVKAMNVMIRGCVCHRAMGAGHLAEAIALQRVTIMAHVSLN
jgi:hypothetical protein